MTVPSRSLDRKLEVLARRIEAERAKRPMTRPPTDGLTSTASTIDRNIPTKQKPRT